jgi:hypothetical protein
MPRSVLIINDGFGGYRQQWDLGPGWQPESHSPRSAGVPALDRLADYDDVAVLGALSDADQAQELAGGLRLAVEQGVRAVVLFPVAVENADRRFLTTLDPTLSEIDRFPEARQGSASHPAFYNYFGSYGRLLSSFPSPPPNATTLGIAEGSSVALRVPIGQGVIYVLPFHVASLEASYNPLLRSVLAAITGFESGRGEATLPQFVDDMRLPGEAEVLRKIEELRNETEHAEEQAAALREFRQMIGKASGDSLERLVLDALNQVMRGTDWVAEDRPDTKAEDFWIVEEDQDRVLAEVKGIGGSVNRQAVNQVDNHRAEHGLGVEDIPGLLVVNTFRNSDDEAQRRTPVSPDVIRHAVRLNVLVMRTLDLYYLLHQALDGKEVGEVLVDALKAAGGWLEVTESCHDLKTA